MGYFDPPKYVFDIRFEIWPILREMGVKKGIFEAKKVKNDKNVKIYVKKSSFLLQKHISSDIAWTFLSITGKSVFIHFWP